MRLLLVAILVGLVLPTIYCGTFLQKFTPPKREILPAPKYELNQPGYDCAGGISGLLKKYLGQRKVAPEKASLVIFGRCVLDPDFNHELARDIKRTSTTIMTISDRYIERIRNNIFHKVVMYYCQDLYKRTVRNPISLIDGTHSVRPYVLFTISNMPAYMAQDFASVLFCKAEYDHIIYDMHSIGTRPRSKLLPQSRIRPHLKVCNVWSGIVQTDSIMQLFVRVTEKSNCTKFPLIGKILQMRVQGLDKTSDIIFRKKISTLDEQFVFPLQTVCLEPLAIVEPSEWVFIEPLSGSLIAILLGTILAVCLLSSLGFVREFNSLLCQIFSSILTPQSVVVPHSAGLFKFQRLLLMGLFIVLFQSVIVNNFRTEVTTALLEPKRDLKIFKRDKNIIDMFAINSLPSRTSTTDVRTLIYHACTMYVPFCYARPDLIQEGLNIPLARSGGPTIPYKLTENMYSGDVLKPSAILRSINEHGLMALTRSHNRRFLYDSGLKIKYMAKLEAMHYRSISPNSRWSPEKHWEASVELLEKCIGTQACDFNGGTQKVLTKMSDLSPVFRMEHLRGTIRISWVLLLISVVVLIGEIVWSYLHNAKRRNRVSVNVRAN